MWRKRIGLKEVVGGGGCDRGRMKYSADYWGTMEKSGEWLVNDGMNTVERGWDQDSLRIMG